MRAAVVNDTTERTITINLVNGPLLDVTEQRHRAVRVIRVERVTIRVVDGVTRELTALGGLHLKNGQTSLGQRDKRTWTNEDKGYLGCWPIEAAPDWAQMFWTGAPAGVNYWKTES